MSTAYTPLSLSPLKTLAILLVGAAAMTAVALAGDESDSDAAVKAEQKKTAKPVRKARPSGQHAKDKQGREEQTRCRMAVIEMSGRVLTREPDFDFLQQNKQDRTLKEWLERLAKARNDEAIDALALEINDLWLSWGHAQELADAIRRFQMDGKPVYAFLKNASAPQYLVASAAREVAMEPRGHFSVTGVGLQAMFFKGTLEKLGMKAQMIQIGKYKGAAEPLTRTEPSKELQNEYDKLLDGLYDQLVEQVAEHRGLMRKAVVKAIDNAPMFGDQAVRYGLVNEAVPRIHWRDSLARRLGKDGREVTWSEDYGKPSGPKVDFSNPFAMMSMMFGKPRSDEPQNPTVAIVHVDGVITTGESTKSLWFGRTAGSETLVKILQKLRRNDNVKAVIVRIASPGGSALASEEICLAMRECAKTKPVIASVSSMAASGGYYVAVGADTILADRAAIVGSIGVVSGKVTMDRFFKEKLGITTWTASRGRNAGLWFTDAWTNREKAVIRRISQKWYDTFVRRVKEGRKGRDIDIDQVAQGRIFTGKQAAENGMVDKLGGMKDAIELAMDRAKLQRSYFKVYPRPRTMYDMFSAGSSAMAAWSDAPGLQMLAALVRRSEGTAYLLTLADLLQDERVLLAMPHYLEIRR
ncbi:MAG: signal peptide peptidase SppA [Phycisphaerae bacterium]